MEVSAKNITYLVFKWVIALFLLFGVDPAKADDTYNFYFQKRKDPPVEKVVPPETSVKAKAPEVKKKKTYKEWELNLGWGTVDGPVQVVSSDPSAASWSSQSHYYQTIYAVGGKWHFSRFFDVHGSLLLPNSPTQVDPTWISTSTDQVDFDQTASSLDFQLMIGAGTTPFHFDFLGFDFLDLGWDVSVVLGDENYLGGNSAVLLWGPRAAINFSRSLSLFLSVQREVQRNLGAAYGANSIRLAYRW